MSRTFSLCISAIALALAPALAKERPNIVYILADDMGYDSVSVNNPKIGGMKTPNIDRLAAQGMNFSDAHSGSAVCTPTRYGLLTGRYCWRSRLKKSVLWDYGQPLIEENRMTVAEFLKAQGYRTAMVGKWHLGLHWRKSDGSLANGDILDTDASFQKNEGAERIKRTAAAIDFSKAISGGPTDEGFDSWFGMEAPNFPPYTWIVDNKVNEVPTVPKPKDMFGIPGMMVEGWKLEEILPTLGKKSAEYIASAAKRDDPFFLYVPLTSPHTPIAPSAEWKDKSGITHYADFVMETDAIVGQIMKAIDDAGITENTLVIFSCDNGSSPHQGQMAELGKKGTDLYHHFKGHKTQIHEGGHRVPFIVRWPAKVAAGSTNDEVTWLGDFFATVADILEHPLPATAAEDSTSILPLIIGDKKKLPNRPLVVNHDIGGRFAIRKGPWKLVMVKGGQLFHLGKDPKEANNVAKEHPDVVKELQETLKIYRSDDRSR